MNLKSIASYAAIYAPQIGLRYQSMKYQPPNKQQKPLEADSAGSEPAAVHCNIRTDKCYISSRAATSLIKNNVTR